MDVNKSESRLLTEFLVELVGRTQSHRLTIDFCEQPVMLYPLGTHRCLILVLPLLVFPQLFDDHFGNFDDTHAAVGFGSIGVYTLFLVHAEVLSTEMR